MKNKTLRFLGLASAISLAAGSLGAQAFHEYVALGDSLTAGVEGGCLVERHQLHSFPKIIATQIGIADFEQPLIGETALTNPPVNACLGPVIVNGSISAGPVSQMGAPLNATLARPYDNLGLPGATVSDLVDLTVANPAGGTADQSALFVLRNFPGGPFEGKSAVDEANLLSPDLVTLWIGNNDVFGAAESGVAVDGVTLTPVAVFQAKYMAIFSAIAAPGRTVVTLNVPDVTAIPFATTIPPVVVNPTTRQPVLVGGAPVALLGPGNATYPCTPVAPDQGCPLPAGTLVTLSASALLGQGIGIPVALGGTGAPLPDGSVGPSGLVPGVLLYPDEVALIQQRTNDINAQIASISSTNGAIQVDIHSIFNGIKANGYSVGGLTFTADFLSGGLFSADGFHATNIGYAIVADTIIRTLNAAKGLSIPEPDLATTFFTPDFPIFELQGPLQPGPFGYPTLAGSRLLTYFPPVDEEDADRMPVRLIASPRRAPGGLR